MIYLWYVIFSISPYDSESTTHSVFGGSSSLVISWWMRVVCHKPLSPVELDHHKSVEVSIILGSRKVVVSLHQSVSCGLNSGKEVMDLGSGVVMNISKSLNISKPLNISTVVFQPDSSVEGHFIVLTSKIITISSIALESFEKISLNALSRSYSFTDSSS